MKQYNSIMAFVDDLSDDSQFTLIFLPILIYLLFLYRYHYNAFPLNIVRTINKKNDIYKNCVEANNSFVMAELKKKIADLTKDIFDERVLTKKIQNEKLKVEMYLIEMKEMRIDNIETISNLQEEIETMGYSLQEQREKITEIETKCLNYLSKIESIRQVLNADERAAKKIPLIQSIIYKEEQETESESETATESESEYED